MDAAKTEKLKALALAADKAAEAIGEWPNVYWIADGIVLDQFAEFMAGCNPATVLELIAEVERLRGDAERYRWWRVFFDDCDATMPDAVCEAYTAVELDAAIDAAITASKEKA